MVRQRTQPAVFKHADEKVASVAVFAGGAFEELDLKASLPDEAVPSVTREEAGGVVVFFDG